MNDRRKCFNEPFIILPALLYSGLLQNDFAKPYFIGVALAFPGHFPVVLMLIPVQKILRKVGFHTLNALFNVLILNEINETCRKLLACHYQLFIVFLLISQI